MIEKHIVLQDIDPLVFYGAGNVHLQMIRALYPKLRITARGDVVRILGDEDQIEDFVHSAERIRCHIEKYNAIDAEDILSIVKGKYLEGDFPQDTIVYNVEGKPVCPHGGGQRELVKAFDKNDLVMAIGPAGTGKTYLSIALAVRSLKQKSVKRIILSRPAVEAGEKLGFLPGDMRDKIDPYLQPLYDALEDMIPQTRLQDMIEKHIIQIAPLAFMRGRTLSNAIVILDEAQNTTPEQIKMFLTRMGKDTKMIVNGDITQIDLPSKQRSGLLEAIEVLNEVKGLEIVKLGQKDIIRHKLVARIVQAYEEYGSRLRTKSKIENANFSSNEHNDTFSSE